MVSSDKKEIKNKSSKGKKLDISAKAIIDNIIITKTDIWAYYTVSNREYDFLDQRGQVSLVRDTSTAFTNLLADRANPLDCHLITTSQPVDVEAWYLQVHELAMNWKNGPGFEKYMQEQFEFLRMKEYLNRVSYIGVHLGKRGALDLGRLNFVEYGFKEAFNVIKSWWKQTIFGMPEEISSNEEIDARRSEKEIYRILSNGALNAKKCTAEELLLLIKRQLYPAMPTPYLDVNHGEIIGEGDIVEETTSIINKNYRWVDIDQMLGSEEYKGYRSVLTFSNFPKRMNETFPFFYAPLMWDYPFTCYSRFTLYPAGEMKKKLEARKKEKKDELDNISKGQDELDAIVDSTPAEVSESLDDLQYISGVLSSDNNPWVIGSYRIVVEATTEENLKNYCANLKQEFSKTDGVNLLWTSGDQVDLFLEQMPGDKARVKTFDQVTNLNMLGISGFNYASNVGDPIKVRNSNIGRNNE